MVSSLNQVRQLYVAKAYSEDKGKDFGKNVGDFQICTVNGFEKEIYFKVKGPSTVLKSDYIPVKNISYVKAIKAEDMATPLKKVLVTLSADVNGGKPIAGQDYILRINLRQFYGMSDQDQYFKDAAVHVTKSMASDATEFYKAMKKALDLCFSREVGATVEENPYLTFTSSATGLVIEEKIQGLQGEIGVEAQERVYFDVVPTTVYDGVDDLIWGKVEVQKSTTTIDNGKMLADLEYFLLGERGDQYRKIGWPNDIETKGMIDPSQKYDVLEIHYSFTDTGVNSYKTEKDITIAIPAGEFLGNIITKFNAATGFEVVAPTAASVSTPVNTAAKK